jgi:hypothetical protein
MMNLNHPSDELLAALADADTDLTRDPGVADHVAGCPQCSATVEELRSLTLALAELPDLSPHRPLRFLPPAAEPRSGLAGRVAGVVRGIFAPALTVGAALALVGAVGTFGDPLSFLPGGQSGAPADDTGAVAEMAAPSSGEDMSAAETSPDDGAGRTLAGAESASESPQSDFNVLGQATASADEADSEPLQSPDEDSGSFSGESSPTGPTGRTVWPVVLVVGVALIAVTLLLRWILVPRAG